MIVVLKPKSFGTNLITSHYNEISCYEHAMQYCKIPQEGCEQDQNQGRRISWCCQWRFTELNSMLACVMVLMISPFQYVWIHLQMCILCILHYGLYMCISIHVMWVFVICKPVCKLHMHKWMIWWIYEWACGCMCVCVYHLGWMCMYCICSCISIPL